ncbi:apoptosis inhibitory protein 5-domain-containing protein [Gautieria morchelliformis]|nr:apoptosis inhibitory protein 5-domain-containing protein [Gautieria morchelliformis]
MLTFQRREALRRLISLTHTASRELKVFAAQNFSHYFKDFPDLEEDVIDSVYDICEDPDAQVTRVSRSCGMTPSHARILGYKAIVSLSAESRKWTRRNTDVLVQLLQSDEPVELKQIQDSLVSHVNLDPAAAIGVLCDHCSLDPDLTAEEKEDREKLRKLVLFFLANTAKKAIVAHFRGPSSEVEQVFRDGLVKAISGADVQETELIVKELLLPLGSYNPRSEHGDELLRSLLDKVKLTYSDLKSKPGPISLAPLHPYLSLLEYVAIVKRAADPGPLLRFYSMALIGKMALQRLDQSSQLNIIQRLADILPVSEEERLKQPNSGASQELNSLRNTVVDACPHILEVSISDVVLTDIRVHNFE